MQNIEFRNKQHLLRRKIIASGIALLCWSNAFSQLRNGPNLPDHDYKPYHFGINLGYNKSHFSFTHHPLFLQRDTIMVAESVNNSGINLAWLVNFRMSDHFDLRLHPLDLTFSEKTFLYSERYKGDSSLTEKKVSSITLSLPLHIKFSSDRINNFKVYTIGGIKFDYDLASNAGARQAEELIKLKRSDISVEVGLGFHFYFPIFVLTPEIKISNGLFNLHSRDESLRYSNVIDKINSKMITFSLTVE
ncbi:MAG TPA: outer membrane beta-barrel protein [Chitinophagaceae bacterium]|nr:outer membrane beta-barrel protein [Chitinophagaceae bacterium]